MGRAARKRRRMLESMATKSEAAPSASAAVPTMSNGGTEPPPAPVGQPPTESVSESAISNPEVFHEPLRCLPDNASTLSDHLRHITSDLSRGLSHTPDLRATLSLLRHCLPRLSASQLSSQLTAWCQFLASALRSPRHAWCRDAICRAIGELLTEAGRLEESHRQLSGGALLSLVTPLLDSREQATAASLNCLRTILVHFGRGCGTLKSEIGRYLVRLLDCDNAAVSSAACRCMALLPQTGAAGSGGVSYAAAWSSQLNSLLRAFHHHLDQLLDGLVEVQTFEPPEGDELELPDLVYTDPVHQRYRLTQRLAALGQVIVAMLSTGTQCAVSVPVTSVLDLVTRCAGVGPASVAPSAPLELQATGRCLPDLHTAAARVLQATIHCCGASLLLRGSRVARLLVSLLQQPCGGASAADAARCQTLSCLRAWLLAVGSSSGLQRHTDQLLSTLVPDIQLPEPAKLTLQAGPKGSTSSGGKKRRAPAADWLGPAGGGGAGTEVGSARDLGRPLRCQAALETLTQLVTSVGPLLKLSVHQELQTVCLKTLYANVSGVPFVPPYTGAGCRRAIYRLLLALVTDPHTDWPAPLHHAVRLFAQGTRDGDPEVVSVCQLGQAACTVAVQPTHPTLFFPIDLSDFSKPPQPQNEASASPEPAEPTSDVIQGESDVIRANSDVIQGDSDVTRTDGGVMACDGVQGADDVTPVGVCSEVSRNESEVRVVGERFEKNVREETSGVTSSAACAGNDVRKSTDDVTDGVSSDRPASPALSWQQKAEPGLDSNRGRPAAVTTVTIASSDDDDSNPPTEDHSSIVLGSEEEDVKDGEVSDHDETAHSDQRPSPELHTGEKRPADVDNEADDEVEILEPKRSNIQYSDDEDMPADVAEMLKDFVDVVPEVE